MHKLLSSSANTADLVIGVDKQMITRRRELTKSKEEGQKGTFYKKLKLIDFFGFADPDKKKHMT